VFEMKEKPMTTVTIRVDDKVIQRAQMRAVEQGTSVNALLTAYLQRYADTRETANAVSAFTKLAKESASSSGNLGRTWTRDELHER
jgi:hypothetical protein